MDVFVARQPILDANKAVYAYELLFRSSPENLFPGSDPDAATSRVMIDSASVFGPDSLTAGRKAFVNVTRRVLTEGLYSVLPSDWLVIELLETVEPDQEVVAACRALKEAGYLFALDDFVDGPGYEPLIELADFIKVDFMASPPEERRRLAQRYSSRVHLVAEKVETPDDVRSGLELGYEYFQGFFFCTPEIISRREIPPLKLNYLRFIQEVSRPDLDFDQVERIVKQDVSLTVKLLRFLNSAAFGYGGRVSSVKQALILLGDRQVKKWATMIALGEMAEDKPRELVVTCLVRARLCELLAPVCGFIDHSHDLFLVGLLSLVDAIVGRPIVEVVGEMPLSTANSRK